MHLAHTGFEAASQQSTSPFRPEQLLYARHANLFERLLIDRLDKRIIAQGDALDFDQSMLNAGIEGSLLCSAILFGALLDRRLWQRWLISSRGHVVDTRGRSLSIQPETNREAKASLASDSSIDLVGGALTSDNVSSHLFERFAPRVPMTERIWLYLEAENLPPLRWVADPLTELLLLHWQDTRRTTEKEQIEPIDAIAAGLGLSSWKHRDKLKLAVSLQRAATTKWRMRMPGFLVESVIRNRRGLVLPDARWLAVFEPERCRVEAFVEPKPLSEPRVPKTKFAGKIHSLLPSGRVHGVRQFKLAGNELAREAKNCKNSPVARLIFEWAASRLDPSRDRRQRQRRLAPSTVGRRAQRLGRFLSDVFRQKDPRLESTASFAKLINEALEKTEYRPTLRRDLACFTDWNCRSTGTQAVIVSKVLDKESGVSAGIISLTDYLAVLGRFDPRSNRGVMTRLMIILGFRAGLRWDETEALASGDLLVEGSIVELTIRNSRENRIKNLGSRRVLPLHVLLEVDECTELIAWWRARRSGRRPQVQGTRAPSEHWRLFPHYEERQLETIKKDIEAALRAVTGDMETKYHVLRHSFVSALVATLLLPEECRERPPIPRIDPDLVSIGRRDRIAPTLLGDGSRARDGLRAVAALLGHSGERSTIRSYFHLHDWLVGIYVARPCVQPLLPASLAGKLLNMRTDTVERAHRRARFQGPLSGKLGPSNPRGRPRKGEARHRLFAVSKLLDPTLSSASKNPDVPRDSGKLQRKPVSAPLSWETLNALFCAIGDEARKDALCQPELSDPQGRSIADALILLLAERTRGRSGTARYRFIAREAETRKCAVRQLSPEDSQSLKRLFGGLSRQGATDLNLLTGIFRRGYDRARGVIRMRSDEFPGFNAVLLRCWIRPAEIHKHDAARSTTVRVGQPGQMDRGYVRALLFATAIVSRKE